MTQSPRPHGQPSRRSGPALAVLLPVPALLAIWVIGGILTVNLGSAWGWGRAVDRPLRAGSMEVRECHPDPGRVFAVQRCSGTATFTPEAQWRPDARTELRDVRRVALVSRTDVGGQTVSFTCYDGTKPADGQTKAAYRIHESCHPDGQVTGPFSGPKLWVPIGAGVGTVVLGMAVFALLVWLFPSPPGPALRTS